MDTAQVLHHEMYVHVYMYTRPAFAYELALGEGEGGKGMVLAIEEREITEKGHLAASEKNHAKSSMISCVS